MDSPKDECSRGRGRFAEGISHQTRGHVRQAGADLKNPDSDYRLAACNYLAKPPVVARATSGGFQGAGRTAKRWQERDAGRGGQGAETWGTADNVPSLIAFLNSEPPFYPHFVVAMEALIPLKNEKGTEAIASYLAKPFHDQDAVRGLRAMGPIAEKAVAGYLNNKEAGVRERAASLIKGYGTKPEVLLPAVIADLNRAEAEHARRPVSGWRELRWSKATEGSGPALDGLLDDPVRSAMFGRRLPRCWRFGR